MSQLDLGSEAEEAQHGTKSSATLAGKPFESVSPFGVMRPSLQGIARTSSPFTHPFAAASDDEVAVNKVSRRVGRRYLVQQLLTSGPLIILDLALLLVVIEVAREALVYAGIRPGLDLSACFLPIAAGFLLISAELGLYPGIRLGPVEEFRRMSMAITSIFAVWVISMWMMSGGLSWQRCVFLALAYGLYMVAMPICRGMLRSVLAKQSWWGFSTLICGNDTMVVRVYDWLTNNRRLGLRPVGVIANRDNLAIDGDEPWYAGEWSEARALPRPKMRTGPSWYRPKLGRPRWHRPWRNT